MKKFNIIIILAAAVFAAGCAKEMLPQDDVTRPSGAATEDVLLDLTMPGSETKTTLGAKSGSNYPVYWQTGDQVSLNGALSVAVPSSDNGSNKTSLYVKNASASSPYNVLYPGVEGVADKVTFPSTQNYKSGSFDANTLPMYATSGSLSAGFTMNYLGAVLRIPVKFNSATTLKQITLASVNGEPLGGTFTVGKDAAGALNGELSSYNAVSTIYYSFGAEDSEFDTNATGVFYIAIPKGTYAKGIEMKIFDTDGNYMRTALFTDGSAVAAGKVYEFTQRAYNADGTVFYIESVSDLQLFAKKGGDRYSLLEAQLLKDIDMTGKEYNAKEFNFYGSLEGGGHTIKGLDKPLFNNLYGSVKNITVNANITAAVESSANKYGLGILARYVYVASGSEEEGDYGQVIENVITTGSINISYSPDVDFSVGGMLGANKAAPMNNCENRASVTVTSLTPSDGDVIRVGGLAGSVISSSANITGCSNTGAVTVTSAEIHKNSLIFSAGGLIGYDTKGNTVANCTNSGAVTVAEVTGGCYFMAGGIVGNATDASFTLTGCENLAGGKVTVGSACEVQAARVGGIIGRVGGANSTVADCINRAAVEIQAAPLTSSNTFGGVVGAVLADDIDVTGSKNYGAVKNAASKLDAIGGVVGYHNGTGEVTGCENHGEVSSTAIPTQPQYFGGIMGKKAASKQIAFSNCANAGAVSITTAEGHDKQIFMGGVIGGCPGGSSTFTNCSNSGDVTNSSVVSTVDPHHDSEGTEITGTSFTPAVTIGGIIGRVTDNAVASITGCTNSGNINNNCAATEIRLGGIVGYTHQVLNDISGCTNSGTISNNVLADFCYVHIGGILGYTNAKVNMSAQNINTGTIQSNPSRREDICGLEEANYDDNTRLAGILCCYYSETRGIMANQKNEGEIVNKGELSCGWVYMGGLQAYAQATTFTGAQNTGYVHNEANVRKDLKMGGILGRADYASQARIQQNSSNSGNVINNGKVDDECRIAGICAEVAKSSDITTASNSGMIKNTAYVYKPFIGGVVAHSKAYVSLNGSSNSGDVIFEGEAGTDLFMAGVIGYQQSNVNSLIVNVSNTGAISCNVDVPSDLEIAGVVADAAGNVYYCTNSGPITIAGNVGKALYASGVCGWNAGNKAMYDCTNNAGGTISMAGGLTVNSQIFCGGVLAGVQKGKSITCSDFTNYANIAFGSDRTQDKRIGCASTAAKSLWSVLGGCVGGLDDTSNHIVYENVANYGNVTFYGDHRMEMGGCVGYAAKLTGTIRNEANVLYKKQATSANGYLGGIVGWIEEQETLSGAVCIGNVDTYDCAARARTGGIIGGASTTLTLMDGCKYKGKLRGTGSGASAGLMCTAGNTSDYAISFKNCVIGTGTQWYHSSAWTTVSNIVLNYSDVGSAGTAMLCGSGTSDSNGATTGTMTNCTIGTVE